MLNNLLITITIANPPSLFRFKALMPVPYVKGINGSTSIQFPPAWF